MRKNYGFNDNEKCYIIIDIYDFVNFRLFM